MARPKLPKRWKKLSTPELAKLVSKLLDENTKKLARIERLSKILLKRVSSHPPAPSKKGARVVEV